MRDLKSLRLRSGLSQADLSEKTGVSEFTISEIEAGKRPNARPSTARKLAAGLGVDVADLYGEALPTPKGAGPLSPEWALKADPDLLRKVIQDIPSDRLREVGAELLAPFYRVRTREDLVEEGPISRGPNVNAFARAGIISEALVQRGEESLEDHVLSLKRHKDATTGGDEAVRVQQSDREVG